LIRDENVLILFHQLEVIKLMFIIVGGGCQTLIYKWRFDQKTCNTASFTFFSSSFWFDLDLFTIETNVFMFRGEII